MTEQPKPKRQIPVALMVIVPVVTVGLALVAVAVAWRSSDPAEVAGSPSATPEVQITSEAFLGCPDCHKDLDKVFKEGLVPQLLYTHEMHFGKGVSECAVCHPANAHEPDRINKPTMSRCFICHGLGKEAIAPGACDTCHPPGMRQKPSSHLAADWVPTAHSEAALEDRFECLTCHEQQTCDSCHGLEMPHEDFFIEDTHPLVYFEDPQVCENCHAMPTDRRDFCDRCHHPEGPDDTAWIRYHPTEVRESGGQECFECHAVETCASCHRRGVEDLSADEAALTPTPEVSPSG